jgi:hypothetical protein
VCLPGHPGGNLLVLDRPVYRPRLLVYLEGRG